MKPGDVSALAIAHVDGTELGTPQNEEGKRWKDESHKKFEQKLGQAKRVSLPLKHCGIQYTKLDYGYRMDQNGYCQSIQPMPIDPQRLKAMKSFLTKLEMTAFRGILGALLWLCLTNMKIICDVVLLQQEVSKAKIKHALAANKVLQKLQAHSEGVELCYPHLTPPLNLVNVHDACGEKESTSYAQEGTLTILKEDRDIEIDPKTDPMKSKLETYGNSEVSAT